MNPFVLVIAVAFTLVGWVSLILTIRAVILGPFFIAAANNKWDWGEETNSFQNTFLRRASYRATPFAIMIVFGWAGFLLVHSALWFLNYVGRIDQYGDWFSFRDSFASLGILPGAIFGWFSVVKLCERLVSEELKNCDITEDIDQSQG